MCGERVNEIEIAVARYGSSPRVWGTLFVPLPPLGLLRFIPTCVGNAKEKIVAKPALTGSSPRVWGTHLVFALVQPQLRFIPTCVGNAYTKNRLAPACAVHPHVCGERQFKNDADGLFAGSSPRVWGTRGQPGPGKADDRFIPTCVGNARRRATAMVMPAVHPHVCGERNDEDDFIPAACGSSPRVWGTLLLLLLKDHCVRFIPTCVGNAIPPFP